MQPDIFPLQQLEQDFTVVPLNGTRISSLGSVNDLKIDEISNFQFTCQQIRLIIMTETNN